MVSARLEGRLVDRYEEAEEAAPEENKSAFLRSLIVDGLDAKDRDVLDAIGVSDELREAVERRRKDGESLDDASRRLLRASVAEARPTRRTRRDRLITGLGGAGVAAVPIALVALGLVVGGVLGGVLAALFAIALSVVAFAFGDLVGDAVGRFQAWAADVLEEEAARNRSR